MLLKPITYFHIVHYDYDQFQDDSNDSDDDSDDISDDSNDDDQTDGNIAHQQSNANDDNTNKNSKRLENDKKWCYQMLVMVKGL